MADYIVCQKKRNSPRLSIRICLEKCPDKDKCTEYQANLKHVAHNEAPVYQDKRNPALSTA
jgi:hypothetical protein